nr:hypothetical protein [Tanacetum cinerariifolium]
RRPPRLSALPAVGGRAGGAPYHPAAASHREGHRRPKRGFAVPVLGRHQDGRQHQLRDAEGKA